MKKIVDWNKVETGMLVEVPRVEYAPRHGWNGWLFSDAVITGKRISKKTGRKIIDVDMCTPGAHKNEYGVCHKAFYADEVFETHDIEFYKELLIRDGEETYEKFLKTLDDESYSDQGEIRFLIDRGFIYDKEGRLMI